MARTPLNVLLLDAYPADGAGAAVVSDVRDQLEASGHAVRHRSLAEFPPFMTAEERAAYHGDQPLIADDTLAAADDVRWATALVFAYPTTTGTVPALLKGWLERVLVPGVGFVLDDEGKVAPGMPQIVRLGVMTTRPGRRPRRDGGRRTIMRTIRLNCARRCRRTWVSIPESRAASARARIVAAFGRW